VGRGVRVFFIQMEHENVRNVFNMRFWEMLDLIVEEPNQRSHSYLPHFVVFIVESSEQICCKNAMKMN